MGKKADALQDELDITEAELQAAHRRIRELEDRVHAEQAPNGHSTLVLTSASSRSFAEQDPEPRVETQGDQAEQDMREAMNQLRRPPSPIRREESMLEIVQANNAERADLHSSQRQANALINRVASALGVTTWDKDGSEILEKAQRFSVFTYWLSSRLQVRRDELGDASVEMAVAVATARVAEIHAVLAALCAPQDLGKFIRERPGIRATQGIFDTAVADKQVRGAITRDHIIQLRDAYAVYAHEKGLRGQEWLAAVVKSEAAMTEFVELLNLVLLPTLERLRLVTSTSAVRT